MAVPIPEEIFYARDAFEASSDTDSLSNGNPQENKEKAEKETVEVKVNDCVEPTESIEYGPHLEPPFWGTGGMLVWNPSNLLDTLDTERLFKAEWRGGKLAQNKYTEAVKNQFQPAFNSIKKEILNSGLLEPRGFYGFFPVITEDRKVILLDPGNFHTELVAFDFPRMPRKKCRSIADYFSPDGDLIGLQVVTLGSKLGESDAGVFPERGEIQLRLFSHSWQHGS